MKIRLINGWKDYWDGNTCRNPYEAEWKIVHILGLSVIKLKKERPLEVHITFFNFVVRIDI